MKRIILSTLLLFFAIGFTACEKIEKDTPQAIKKLIRNTEKGGQVEEYEYKNEYIYNRWFPDCVGSHCAGNFYDKNATLLWSYGAAQGISDIPADLRDKAIFKRIIWTSNKTKKQVIWIQ